MRIVAAVLLSSVMAAGCGGSSGKQDLSETGRVVINIAWPATRGIPAATRSIKVVARVLQPLDGPQVGEVVVPRPVTATSSQAVLNNIPSVRIRLTATAHVATDASDAAIAIGTVEVTVVENSTVTPNIVLGPISNVDSVSMETEDFIAIGHDSTFYVFAEDSTGQPVIVNPSEWVWLVVSGPATVTPGGATALYRGTAEGQATVKVTHTPTGKFVQRTLLVAACSEYTTSGGAGAGGTVLNVSAFESTATATGRFEFYVEAPTLVGTASGTIQFTAYIEDETLSNPTPGTASASASWPGGSDSVSGDPKNVTRNHPFTLQHGQRITINASATASAGTDIGISAGVSVNFVNNPAGVNVRLLQCPD